VSAAPANPLITALASPAAYPHAVREVRCVETHISWVLLTGEFAYKIKKPVDFGFLDFSTLEKRRVYCEAELALNRRFAPSLYLDVVPICTTGDGPRMGGNGEVVEWAVKMRQFDDDAQMDRRLAAGAVTAEDLVGFAEDLAYIHDALPVAGPETHWGTSAAVLGPVKENFEQIAPTRFGGRRRDVLADLAAWGRRRHAALQGHFVARRAAERIRECHGDLHLSNLVWLDGRATAFDCIEFNPGLRWIDVASDVAFLVMDLETRGRADLAHAFLDRWLERTGDYPGARAADFYTVYRSMVRAKVAALQAHGGSGDVDSLGVRFDLHVDYAAKRAFRPEPRLVITCGLSGSGKSWVAERLVTRLPAVRLRSDVERKRIHDLAPGAQAGAAVGAGIYDAAATEATYMRLAECAGALLEGSVATVVDATFLDAARRETFRAMARTFGARFRVLHCVAPADVLRARIRARQRTAHDPSDADERILDDQIARAAAPPTGPEVVTVDTSRAIAWDDLVRAL
jgi:aminoglycoside phosphotransferase family enzyme/predicted kinase